MRPTRDKLIGAAISPTVDELGVPRCSEHRCIQHDGIHCKLETSRPVASESANVCTIAVMAMVYQIEVFQKTIGEYRQAKGAG